MRKGVLAAFFLLLIMGCTVNETPEVRNLKGEKGEEVNYGGSLLEVKFEGFPELIKPDEKKYFRIKLIPKEDLEDVEFEFYLPKFESNCNMNKFIGRLKKGSTYDFGCYLISPKENGTYEGKWEVRYSLSERKATIEVLVGKGGGGRVVKRFQGLEGEFSAEPSAAESNEEIRFSLKLTDPELVENPECWCKIEEAEIRIPRGFSIVGLENWRKSPCGNYSCYRRSNLNDLDEEFYGNIGVSKPVYFKITAKLWKIWKGKEGKVTITVS